MSEPSLTPSTGRGQSARALVIATRGSPLALAQAAMLRALLLRRQPVLQIDQLVIRTKVLQP